MDKTITVFAKAIAEGSHRGTVQHKVSRASPSGPVESRDSTHRIHTPCTGAYAHTNTCTYIHARVRAHGGREVEEEANGERTEGGMEGGERETEREGGGSALRDGSTLLTSLLQHYFPTNGVRGECNHLLFGALMNSCGCCRQ